MKAEVLTNILNAVSNFELCIQDGNTIIPFDVAKITVDENRIVPHLPNDVSVRKDVRTSISDLGLDTRTENALLGEKIYTVEQLMDYDKCALFRIQNFGKLSLSRLNDALASRGLKITGT